jgi:hypothetical protein
VLIPLPLCERLSHRGIPFVFSTGDPEALPPERTLTPVVSKPFAGSDLTKALIDAFVGVPALEADLSLAVLHESIFQGHCRIIRQGLVVKRLKAVRTEPGPA